MSRSFEGGSTINTMNKTMNGRAGLTPDSHWTFPSYFVVSDPITPIRRPPPKVNGSDWKAPRAAAPKDAMTMVKKPPALKAFTTGPSRIPEIAANVEPMSQA